MNENDRVGVMAAVGEACANAAEHAYRGSEPGPMSVRAHVDADGVLTVSVHDDGTWRPPDRDPGDRGRGLLIMRQLVDGVSLDDRDGTTVTLTVRLRHTSDDEPAPGGRRRGHDGRRRPVRRPPGRARRRGGGRGRRRSPADPPARGQPRRHRAGRARPGGVTLFSSAAVRVLLAVARIARDEGWRLVVHAAERGVTRHVLEVSGLGGLVDLR